MSHSTPKIIPMSKNSESPESMSRFIQNGKVISVSYEKMKIDLDGKTVEARKAFSCLIDPEPGDSVLCCREDHKKTYILAVLERKRDQKVTMSFPSDATLKSQKGNLNFFSEQSVTIAANKVNSLSKKEVHQSEQAFLSFDTLSATGTELQANFKTVRLISNLINTMARQVIDKFKGYIRHTEDNDQVEAGQLTRRTDGLFSMDSGHTVMISKKETKIDGEKIYMA